jgi:hypothetical protein
MGLSTDRLPPEVRPDFPRAWGFQVQYDVHARVDGGDVHRAARLQQDRPPRVGESRHEREDLGLEEWLSTRHLDKAVFPAQGTAQDLLER